jgi:hypothetical protein
MADKTFEIAIRTTADPAGVQQIDGELTRLKEEAASTHGVASGSSFDDTAEQASLRREILATEQATTAQTTEQVALEERRTSIIQQRQALLVSEVEALQLEAAGQTELAAALTEEIALRRAALQIQQSTTLSEEQSLLLARQRIGAESEIAAAQLAQSQSGLLSGINIGRARQEATTLVREIATGTVNMRTMGALAGALGPALGISAIAALVVGEVISSIGKKIDDNRISSEKESVEIQKQVQHWKAMAAAAKDFSDVQKLTEEVSLKVSEINEKIRQIPGEASSGFFETELNGLKLITNFLGTEFETSTDKAIKKQREFRDVIEAAGKTYEASAKHQVEAVRSIIDLPYAQAISKAADAIAQLSVEQENLNRSDKKQEEDWQRKQSTIAALSRTIDDLSQHQVLLTQAEELSAKVSRERDPARHAALQKELDDLREKLLIIAKIKQVSDDSAAAGKAFTEAEAKAIENEVKGPLDAKLKILRQLAELNPGGGYQKQIDKLLDVKPPDASETTKRFYEKIVADATSTIGEVRSAKANLELLLQQQLRDITKIDAKPAGSIDEATTGFYAKQLTEFFKAIGNNSLAEAVGALQADPFNDLQRKFNPRGTNDPGSDRSLDALQNKSSPSVKGTAAGGAELSDAGAKVAEMTKAAADQAKAIGDIMDAALNDIPLAFVPVSEAIQTEIPQAIERGTANLATAVVAAVGSIDNKFAKNLEALRLNLQAQINDLS